MSSSTRISLLFFTTLVLLSAQIQARDSYFFGKFHRESSPKDQNVLPFETSEKATVQEPLPKEQEPTFVPESETGYGLYGHETTYDNNKYDEKVNDKSSFSTPSLSETEEQSYDQKYYPTKTESYYNNGDEEFNNKKYDEKVNDKSTFSTPRLSETEESYDQKYPKSYDNNGEEFNNKYDEDVKDESLYDENVKDESLYNEEDNNKRSSSYYKSNAYGTESEQETPYKGYNHNLERQGMSDTRFMENGKYYYDPYNPKNHGHYYRKPHMKTPSGYYSSPTTDNTYEQSYNEEEKSFKDPYNSKWEKNEQPEDQFKP